MRNKIGFFCVALLLAAGIHAQQVFPALACETLSDKKITIPDHVKGKKTVVGIAFSAGSDKALKAWAQPLYNALMADPMGGMMGGNMYNANVCYVGMLHGIARLGMGELKERSRRNVDRKLHDYFMISDQDANALCEQLGVKDKNEPHFFVLNEKGEIIYHTSGEYSDKKLNEMTAKLLD